MEKHNIANELEMFELGVKFAKRLSSGDCVNLIGDMGAGKTLLTKGICRGLGSDELITSPTYSIMQIYHGKFTIYHYDFYRIIDEDEALELGLTEYFESDNSVSIIEWGENVSSYLPKNMIKIEIVKTSNSFREVMFYG